MPGPGGCRRGGSCPRPACAANVKLSYALDTLAVPAGDRTAVDVGAAAGGFTTALLRHGAPPRLRRRHRLPPAPRLLRQDPRVVDLERHNLAVVDRSLVPEPVDLVTLDLSYLSVAGALPHLERLCLAPGADLLALVKPTFELHRPTLAARPADVAAALRLAAGAAEALGWAVLATCDAPRTGRRGAREAFIPRPPDTGRATLTRHGAGEQWWIGVLFAIGSAVLRARGRAPLRERRGRGCGRHHVLRRLDLLHQRGGAPVPDGDRRWRAWAPGNLDWSAGAVQLAGTLFFNISTFDATARHLSAGKENKLVWSPDAFGSICFLVASAIALFAVHAHVVVLAPARAPVADRRAQHGRVDRLRRLGGGVLRRARHRPAPQRDAP
jgi:predicted rRNA methylase YqxC with S4 and FtsJ domains